MPDFLILARDGKKSSSAPNLHGIGSASCVNEVEGPPRWFLNKVPEKTAKSLSQETYVDHSPMRAVAQPHKTAVDFEFEKRFQRALKPGLPFHGISNKTEKMTDFSGHKAALKRSPTVYDRVEEIRKIRASMELKQRLLTKTGRGLRPKGKNSWCGTDSDNYRWFGQEEMSASKSPPTFTAWHEHITPLVNPQGMVERWTFSDDSMAGSTAGDSIAGRSTYSGGAGIGRRGKFHRSLG